MGLGQMLIVLLAIILFSSVMITLNNNLQGQVTMAVRNIYYTQGIKIADYIFQEYESKLISLQRSFEDIFTELEPGIERASILVSNVTYDAHIRAVRSDILGNPVSDDYSLFQRIYVRVIINDGVRTFTVGTDDFPFSKVFSDMGL